MHSSVCKKFFWIEIKEVLSNTKTSTGTYMYMTLTKWQRKYCRLTSLLVCGNCGSQTHPWRSTPCSGNSSWCSVENIAQHLRLGNRWVPNKEHIDVTGEERKIFEQGCIYIGTMTCWHLHELAQAHWCSSNVKYNVQIHNQKKNNGMNEYHWIWKRVDTKSFNVDKLA